MMGTGGLLVATQPVCTRPLGATPLDLMSGYQTRLVGRIATATNARGQTTGCKRIASSIPKKPVSAAALGPDEIALSSGSPRG
jgi:hypothetical protein